MSTCYKTNTTINTINNVSAESKFKARIVEKERRSTWWEHTFDVVFTYCPSVAPSERPARSFGRNLGSHSFKGFEVDSTTVNVAGNVVTAKVKVISSYADAAEAERAADKVITAFMKRDENLLDAKFQLSSEQKEKVTKFDAWDGIDSYG